MPKVSVIIAVYNAEHFLRRCMETLLGQTYHDLQMIFVDDGSTDESLRLIKELAAADDRVSVVALPHNQGLPRARNAGLSLVEGDLVCTLDADDWLSADAIEQAVAVFLAHPATDCVLFRFVYVDEATHEEHEFPMAAFDVLTGHEAMRRTLLQWDGIQGIYMVRAAIHQRYPFDETTRVYSDENTSRLHFLASREVRQCSGIYYYRQHPASLTHAAAMSYFDRLKANQSLLRQLQEEDVDEQTLTVLHDRCWLGVVDAYYYYWLHRREWQSEERATALSKIRSAYAEVDAHRLSSLSRKFGYMPSFPLPWAHEKMSWRLFRCQEHIYFVLKKLFR